MASTHGGFAVAGRKARLTLILLLAGGSVTPCLGVELDNPDAGMRLTVNPSGSYALTATDGPVWREAYPALNGRDIHPLEVQIESTPGGVVARYRLQLGTVVLRFNRTKEGFEIRSELRNLGPEVVSFQPLNHAMLDGITHAYRQGFGFGGPSGSVPLADTKDRPERIESHGQIAVWGQQKVLLVHVSHHEDYGNVYTLAPDGYRAGEQARVLSAGFSLEGVAAKKVELPGIFVSLHDTVERALTYGTEAVAKGMKARPPRQPLLFWASWSYLFHNISDAYLDELLPALAKMDSEKRYEFVQIDAGYYRSPGDWLATNERFPHGMRSAYKKIADAGYKPGLWIAPFMVGNRSNLAKQHPDWLLRGMDGKRLTPWKYYGEQKQSGIPDEEYYILDTSHPDALAYLRKSFRQHRQDGVRLFKTDFLTWGMQESHKVLRARPGRTSVQYFREAMQAIREEIGDDAYLLGCISPFMPMVGLADGMRYAGDAGPTWSEGGEWGTPNLLRELPGVAHMNFVLWQNDPDAIFVREQFHDFVGNEKQGLALLAAASGGIVSTSDPIETLGESQREFMRFVEPRKPMKPRYPFLLEKRLDIVLLNQIDADRFVLFALNISRNPLLVSYDLSRLTGLKRYEVRSWRDGRVTSLPVSEKELYAKIQGRDYLLLMVSRDGFKDPEISNLWDWR